MIRKMVIFINKDDFLSELNEIIKEESYESLKELFLKFALYMDEEMYESALKAIRKPVEIIPSIKVELDNAYLLDVTLKLCKEIEGGEYEFTYRYGDRDDYYDYYGDYQNYRDYDELFLKDENGLCEKIVVIIEACKNYLFDKKYEEVFKVYDLLFGFEIEVYGYDHDDVDLTDLFRQYFIKSDLKKVLMYYAYSALMVLRGEERCEKIYDIEDLAGYNIDIADVEKIGEDDIPDRIEFADEWINLLKDIYEGVEHLLIEAIKFRGGTQCLKDFVSKFGEDCPDTYIDLITTLKNENNLNEAIKFAMEGLDKEKIIDKKRVEIADLAYDIGNKIADDIAVKRSIIEGFKSSLDLSHFIRLFQLNDEKIMKDMVKYMDDRKDQASLKYYLYMHFLNGNYELVLNECKEYKDKIITYRDKYPRHVSFHKSLRENMVKAKFDLKI